MESTLYFDKYLNVWQEETDAIFESYDNEIELSYFTEGAEPKKSLGKRIAAQIKSLIQKAIDAIHNLIVKITGKGKNIIPESKELANKKIKLEYNQTDIRIIRRIKEAKSMSELKKIEREVKAKKFIKVGLISTTIATILGGGIYLKKSQEKLKKLEIEASWLEHDTEFLRNYIKNKKKANDVGINTLQDTIEIQKGTIEELKRQKASLTEEVAREIAKTEVANARVIFKKNEEIHKTSGNE